MKLLNPHHMKASDGHSLALKGPMAGSGAGSNDEGQASNADLARGAQDLPQQLSVRTGLEASMFSLGQQSMSSKQSLSLYREKHANAIKQESIKLLKAKKKQDAREMKQMKERSRQIKAG